MGAREDAARAWREIWDNLQEKIEIKRGILGNGAGVVRVPNRPDLCYMRLNAKSQVVWQVINDEVADVDGLMVLAEKRPDSKYWQIVDIDKDAYISMGTGFSGVKYKPTHHEEHEWPDYTPGPDAVNVYKRALVDLRTDYTTPYGLNVMVRPTIYTYDNQEKRYLGTSYLPLSSYVPGSGKRLVLTYLDTRDNLVYALPGPVTAYNILSTPETPFIPPYSKVSAVVELHEGQSEIKEADIEDVRDWFNTTPIRTQTRAQRSPLVTDDRDFGYEAGAVWVYYPGANAYISVDDTPGAAVWKDIVSGSGSGGWPYTVLNESTGTTYDTLTSAEAAASTGEVLRLGDVSLAEAVTVDADITIKGISDEASIITRKLTVTNGGNLADLRIDNTTDTEALEFNTIDDSVNRNCYFSTVGVADGVGVYINGTFSVFFYDCQMLATTGSGNRYGLRLNGGSAAVFGGRMSGASADLRVENSAIVRLYNMPILANNNLSIVSGTVKGFFQSGLGDTYYIDTDISTTPFKFESAAFPADGFAMIGSEVYATIAAAITAASTGDIIKLGAGTFTEAIDIDESVTIVGLGPDRTKITSSGADHTVAVLANDVTIEGVEIENTGTTSNVAALTLGGSSSTGATIRNCRITRSGAATTSWGMYVGYTGHVVEYTEIAASGGTTTHAVRNDTAACSITFRNCTIDGTDRDVIGAIDASTITLRDTECGTGGVEVLGNSSILNINGGRVAGGVTVTSGSPTINLREIPTLTGTISTTATGFYRDSSGNIQGYGDVDILPYGDAYGLWFRKVDFGLSSIDEHWHQGSDELTWTGWAAYTGYNTPSTVSQANSKLIAGHSSSSRFFYYRSYANADTTLVCSALTSLASECGLMVDDGVNAGDGEGANNFIRFYVIWSSATSNATLASDYRTGGGGVTNATYLSFPPQDFISFALRYGNGTRWSNWGAVLRIAGDGGVVNSIVIPVSGLSWTPARHGLYGRNTVGGRLVAWDWFIE